MDTQDRTERQALRRELLDHLRKLVEWKANNAVKLLFLEADGAGRVSRLDLAGVTEVKRNANGSLEVKCVDKVRVLGMMRELMDQERDGALGDFLDGLSGAEGGDGQ